MELRLFPGDDIVVTLDGTDGEFTIKYSGARVTIKANLPDTRGRVGVIYDEDGADGKPVLK